jgi:hypothetical protein
MDLADQAAEIESLKEQLRSKRPVTATVERRLEALQRENDELKLYLAAVIRLLMAKKIATTEEIKTMVAAVDRQDGVEDQKYTGPMMPDA